MILEYFILALKNLRKRGLRSWLTMLGIFIGIAALVSLISLGQGLENAIVGQFSSLDPDKLLVQSASTGFGPPGSTAVNPMTEHDLEIIKKVQGVDLVVPRIIRVVKIEYNRVIIFNGANSVPPEEEEMESALETFDLEIDQGRLLEPGERGKIIIGQGFAERDDFGKEVRLGTNLLIQDKEFEVIGILKKSSTIFINEDIIMAEEDLKEILEIDDEIDLIEVDVVNADQAEKVAEDIKRALRKDRDQDEGEEDFSVQTPVQSIAAISTILNIVNLVVSGIAAISLLIGSVGIANTMFTSVLERRKEIGIMKSIGAKNSDVLKIFIVESAFLGLIGGIIGSLLGLGIALGVSSAAGSFLGGIDLQVQVSFPLLLGAISFSLLIGLISGIIPAWQASRLNPVEALRK